MANNMNCEMCDFSDVTCVGHGCLFRKYFTSFDDFQMLCTHYKSNLLRDVLERGDIRDPADLSLWIRTKLEDIRAIGELRDMINQTGRKTSSSLPDQSPTHSNNDLDNSTLPDQPSSPSSPSSPPAHPSRPSSSIQAPVPRKTHRNARKRTDARKRTVTSNVVSAEPVLSDSTLVASPVHSTLPNHPPNPSSPSRTPAHPSRPSPAHSNTDLDFSTLPAHPPSPSIHLQRAPQTSHSRPPTPPSSSPTLIPAPVPRRTSARVEQRPRKQSVPAQAASAGREVHTRKRKQIIPCHKNCNCKRKLCQCFKKRMREQREQEQDAD